MTGRVINYKPGHRDFINPEDIYSGEGELLENCDGVYGMDGIYQKTLLQGNDIIAIIGIARRWAGFGECWTYPTKLVKKHPRFYYQNTKELLAEFAQKLELKRVQTTISAEFGIALNWIEKLGFQREGLCRHYGGPDKHHYMYARFF